MPSTDFLSVQSQAGEQGTDHESILLVTQITREFMGIPLERDMDFLVTKTVDLAMKLVPNERDVARPEFAMK